MFGSLYLLPVRFAVCMKSVEFLALALTMDVNLNGKFLSAVQLDRLVQIPCCFQ